jgi:hypothetical protein
VKKSKTIFYKLILIILPVLLALAAVYLNDARGPYWLGTNSDPEYVYLLNALNLADFHGVGHIDHPGTTVQVLGALTIRAKHALGNTGEENVKTDVLKRPEAYLTTINTVMVVLNALMLLLLGALALKLTRKLWVSLLLQAVPFVSTTRLQFGLTRVTPEPLLFLATTLTVALMLLMLHKAPEPGDRRGYIRLITGFALVTGFGIATKITFIPLMVIPFLALSKLKYRIYYIITAGVSFILFTLPIIRQYPRFFGWIFKLLGHSGRYGSGPSGLAEADKYLQNMIKLLTGNPVFSIIMVISLVVIAIILVHPKHRKEALATMRFRLLAGTAAAQMAGLMMVSKHTSNHYLLPVLNLSAILLYLIYLNLKHIGGHSVTLKTAPAAILAAVGFVLILTNPVSQIQETADGLTRLKEKSMALHDYMKQHYPGSIKIYYYRSSSPEYALKFGSDLSRSYHADQLQQLYKNVYFYDIWTKRFSDFFYDKTIPPSVLNKINKNDIVIQGTRGQKIPEFKLKEVPIVKSYETIYKVITSK